jgi:hypothetical protein
MKMKLIVGIAISKVSLAQGYFLKETGDIMMMH